MPDKKQTQKVRLSPEMRGASKRALRRGQSTFNQYYGSDLPSTYVGISPEREAALGMMEAPGAAYGPAYDEWSRTVSGEYLDPTTNPYFRTMVDRSVGQAMAPVMGQFASYGLGPGRSSAGGFYAADIGANTAARLYGALYEGERGRMESAVGMAPMMDELQYSDAMRMGRVGLEREEDQAAQQREELRQFMWPMQLVQQEQAFLGANPLVTESQTVASQPFDWLGFVGGLAGSLMPSPTSLFSGGGGP